MLLNYCVSTESFQRRLRELMEKRGLNQNQLSKRSGIPRQLINSYVQGKKKAKSPGLENIILLTKALHCTFEELTGLESMRRVDQELQEIRAARKKIPDDILQLAQKIRDISDANRRAIIENLVIEFAEKEAKRKGESR